MRIDISDIVKSEGESLDVEFSGEPEGLKEAAGDDFVFCGPVDFKGKLTNLGGTMRLDGSLKTQYSSRCYRCLKDIGNKIDIRIKEDFLSSDRTEGSEDVYTYEGNFIIIDKVLKDNIILNLPMKEVCTEDCKGLCPRCGTDLNVKACDCREDEINPKMEILKDFFNN